MKKLIIALIFLIHIFINIYGAQAVEFFTLDKAIETALLQNPDLNSIKFEMKHHEHAAKEIRASLMPNLTLNWDHYFTDERTEDANKFTVIDVSQPSGTRELSPLKPLTSSYLKLSQSVINIPLWKTYSAALKNKIAYDYKYISAQQELIYKVTESYINVLKTKALKDIRATNLRLAERKLRAVKHFVAVGLKPYADLLTQKVNVIQAQKEKNQIDKDYISSVINLNTILGRKEDLDVGLLKLETNYNPNEIKRFFPQKLEFNHSLYLKEITEKALVIHPVTKQMTALYGAAKDMNTSAKTAYIPQIGFETSYGYSTSAFEGSNRFSFFTIIKASVPVFDGFKGKASIEKTKDDLKKTESDFLKTRNQIVQNISLSLTDLISAKKQMEVAYNLYKQMAESYRISYDRYRVGLASQIEYYEMKKAFQEAKLNRINSYYDFIVNKNKYLLALGILNTSEVDNFFPKIGSTK